MYKSLLLVLVMFSSSFSNGLTLNEALESTYEHNVALKVKREELKVKDESIMEVFSRMLPSAQLSKKKRNGKQKSSDEQGGRIQTIDGTTGHLIFSQNLFRGGSDVASLISARNSIEASREELKMEEARILVSAVESFLKLKGAESKYINAKTMADDTKKYVNATEHRFEAGEVTKTDVARAKATFASAKARKSNYWAEYLAEKTHFKNITGVEGVDLILSDVKKDIQVPTNVDSTIVAALRTNPNIIRANKMKNAATAGVKASLGTILPSVDLKHEINDYRHAPIASSERHYKYQHLTAMELTIPIFDGGAKWSKIRSAKRQNQQQQYEVKRINEEVTYNAVAAWSSFDGAQEVFKSQEEALKATKLAYEGALEEEKAGIRASVDVIIALKEYLEQYDHYVDTKTKYYVSLYSLKAVIGECNAKGLGLKVKYYDPLKNYNKIKWQLIGAY